MKKIFKGNVRTRLKDHNSYLIRLNRSIHLGNTEAFEELLKIAARELLVASLDCQGKMRDLLVARADYYLSLVNRKLSIPAR